ncbi:hypothetical protein AYI68_g5340, partial [Smittium mucronatum]
MYGLGLVAVFLVQYAGMYLLANTPLSIHESPPPPSTPTP